MLAVLIVVAGFKAKIHSNVVSMFEFKYNVHGVTSADYVRKAQTESGCVRSKVQS
jgi:hypothetical protein